MKVSKDTICREVGGLIFKARKAAGLTQAELSERLDISRAAIANFETGRQNLSLVRLFEIADVLGVSVQSLIPTGGVDHRLVAKRERQRRDVKELEAKLRRAKNQLEG